MVIIAAEVMYQNLAFDALQSYQEGALGAVEGQTTQLAEKVGYKLGSANYAEKHPILNFFRYEEDDLPAH